ncbi:MAG: NAD-dependent epimerase/dehydratase family protein [Deltaproteobacteria bacterium]|nr:NAD-dependent epimerase/dehydratase family protein [Deltaproteobacteria bacterium]
MATVLVTGAAGFIGSHLAERLISEGHRVRGVDCFTDYYPRADKEANLEGLRRDPRFELLEADLCDADVGGMLREVSCVFHQAAQAGVRRSWGKYFESYARNNVLATQRLLEGCREAGTGRVVYASSSSVYGDSKEIPLREGSLPRPVSPYGVTKLAAEHLCVLYTVNYRIPTVSLRYFTVYGPRQRPDMAFHLFIRAMLEGRPVEIYGDGEQTRDFTFISDAVDANFRAMTSGEPGGVYNIGGGSRTSVNAVLDQLEEISGRKASRSYKDAQKGDVRHTLADTTRAEKDLGFVRRVPIKEGLKQEHLWLEERLASGSHR